MKHTETVGVRITRFGDYIRVVRMLPLYCPLIRTTSTPASRLAQSQAMKKRWATKQTYKMGMTQRLERLERMRAQCNTSR